jgi:hypothetical protein
MKWLNPKENPIPNKGYIIAYVDHEITSGYIENELFIDSLHFEEDFSGENIRYGKDDIIAWMPLPSPPNLEN